MFAATQFRLHCNATGAAYYRVILLLACIKKKVKTVRMINFIINKLSTKSRNENSTRNILLRALLCQINNIRDSVSGLLSAKFPLLISSRRWQYSRISKERERIEMFTCDLLSWCLIKIHVSCKTWTEYEVFYRCCLNWGYLDNIEKKRPIDTDFLQTNDNLDGHSKVFFWFIYVFKLLQFPAFLYI